MKEFFEYSICYIMIVILTFAFQNMFGDTDGLLTIIIALLTMIWVRMRYLK